MSDTPAAATSFEARVVASFGRHFTVEADNGNLIDAVRRGRKSDVVVGDRVRCVSVAAQQAVIETTLARRSLLFRADAVRVKPLAANVEQVAIVFAPRPAFNPRFVWRALVAARLAGLDSIVVLNKIDLEDEVQALDRAHRCLAQLALLGTRTRAISAKREPAAARAALAELCTGRATLLVGQSGMGKSTLLNLLVPDANARTQEYSRHLDLGRQTTTASRWFWLPPLPPESGKASADGALVDTPGFQAFGVARADPATLAAAMPDFLPHLGGCRFLDCRHVAEPDCAISDAVDAGAIDRERFTFYRELVNEELTPSEAR